ncbi:MAG: S9 family peptidase [Acidobacteriota bacterium]
MTHGEIRSLAGLCWFMLASPLLAADAPAPRPLRPDDVFELREVNDPQLSPDGSLVAYTVTASDRAKDREITQIYLVPSAGGEPQAATRSDTGESARQPRFSPDGRTLAYLAKHEKGTQVWLRGRDFGQSTPLTAFPGGVSELAWSPDGTRLALVVSDPDPNEIDDDATGPKTAHPIVIHRQQFKRDVEGYLGDLYSHLVIFDVRTKTSFVLTSGAQDDSEPAWSPDGTRIAFTSNRTAEPDFNQNSDIFVVDVEAGATPRALGTSPRTDTAPTWSPDGKSVAWVQGGDPEDLWYDASRIVIASAATGGEHALTGELDRNVEKPTFTPDGSAIWFQLEDGGNRHLAHVEVATHKVERVLAGERDVAGYSRSQTGSLVVLESEPNRPNDVLALAKDGTLRNLSHANQDFLADIRLGAVSRFKAQAKNGPPIDVFLTLPPDAKPGVRLPTLVRIHGGPASQFSTEFQFELQMLAAGGYAVLAANPRGSTGYGRDFSRAIWADWGNKDYDDIMAATDKAIALGVADADRMGVLGWSYGGILTDHILVRTGRFKAAATGASEVNYLANYGYDQYQYEWEKELGLPWKNAALWMRLSPFFEVEKITTPTLILCGTSDWNVPAINSEQLFQALRRLDKPAELVLYPGQSHTFTTPSYRKDRWERYAVWFDRWLLGKNAPMVR